MRKILTPIRLAAAVAAVVVSACGSSGPADRPEPELPTVVVTSNVLGDIVTAALGDAVGDVLNVEVIMPRGADPHGFAPSARQAEAMENADLLVINGLDFEAGMTDIIANITDTGTALYDIGANLINDASNRVRPSDPHIWMDADLVAMALEPFAEQLATATGIDLAALDRHVTGYIDELHKLDVSIAATLTDIPAGDRNLVTNHDALAYFAARYDLKIVGTVIPSVSTNAEASANDLERLADLIGEQNIPAIFAETTESGRLAEALAQEVGSDVSVVELYTGSLGEPGSGAETYIDMMTTNADRIAEALG